MCVFVVFFFSPSNILCYTVTPSCMCLLSLSFLPRIFSAIWQHLHVCVYLFVHTCRIGHTLVLSASTVDSKRMFTKSFTEHVSISDHQIREHELVTSVEDYNVLMLISCKICKFVDYHVDGGR